MQSLDHSSVSLVSRRILVIGSILALVMSLMGSIPPTHSNAQGDGSPVAEETPISTEPGNVTISKLLCGGPIGPNPSIDAFVGAGATASCLPAPAGFQFSINNGQSTVSTDSSGVAVWLGYSGQVVLQETSAPPPYSLFQMSHYAYCRQVDPATSSTGNYIGGNVQNASYAWATPEYVPGSNLDCYWINFLITGVLHQKLTCQEGNATDFESMSMQELDTFCAPANGIPFSLAGQDGESSTGVSPFAYSSSAMANDRNYRVTEDLPEDNGAPVVFCGGYLPGQGLMPFEKLASVDVSGQSATIDYIHPAYASIVCRWFNLPATTAVAAEASPDSETNLEIEQTESPEQDGQAGGTVIIRKHLCPPGYLPEPTTDVNAYAPYCPGVHPGQTFRTSRDDEELASAETDGAGLAEMSGVSPGLVRISELPKEGWPQPAAYCRTYQSGSSSLPDYQFVTVETWGVGYDLQDGFVIECLWFNVPPYQGPEGAETGAITLHKFMCPTDFSTQSATAEELEQQCGTPQELVEFTLEPSDANDQTATSSSNGTVVWDGVASGPAKVAETPPNGTITYRVACRSYNSANEPSGNYVPLDQVGNEFFWFIQAGYTLECNWYNIESGNQAIGAEITSPTPTLTPTPTMTLTPTLSPTPTITLTPTLSPTPTITLTPTLTSTPMITLTPTLTSTPTITLTPTLTSTPTITLTPTATLSETATMTPTSTPSPSPSATATWTVSATSTSTGTQGSGALPSGGTTQSNSQSNDSGPTAVSVAPGVQPAGAGVVSTPGPDEPTTSTIEITQFSCEPGFVLLASDSDPELDCQELTSNVLYTLAGEPDVEEIGITGDDEPGIVRFTDLDAGDYLLTQSLPADVVSSFIGTCTSNRRAFYAANPFIPFAYPGPDGEIGLTLVEGETLACSWYDILQEDQPDGEIIVTKYWCPDSSIGDACVLYEDGVTFSLLDVDDPQAEPVEVTTDETGSATVAAIGRFRIEETGNSQICLVDTTATDPEGNLVVEEGDSIEVTIYNCGPRPGS